MLSSLAVGVYQVEFIGWERTGVAHFEVYAANGAFTEDADSGDWKLLGEGGGLELVQGPAVAPTLRGIALIDGRAVISFTSAVEPSSHQLDESSDLISWRPSTGMTFVKGANNVHTASVTIGAGPARFYRLRLP